MVNKQTSERIKIMSFLCTVLVVLRHSTNIVAFWGDSIDTFNVTWVVEKHCTFLTDIAVPYFFIVSGFFFFRTDYYSLGNYFSMIKKKSKGLLIPFVFWNIVGLSVIKPLNIYPEFVEGNVIEQVLHLLNSDWYGPLWYVRDLMLLMLLVPMYGWLFKKKFTYVLTTILLVIACMYWVPGNITLLTAEGVMFFLTGGLIQLYAGITEYRMSKKYAMSIMTVWLILCFTIVNFHAGAEKKMAILLGIMALWGCISFIPSRLYNVFLKLSKYSFFIYVTHMYIEKVIKVGLARMFPTNGFVALLTYFNAPIATIVICIILAMLMSKYMPKLYKLSTGAR